jgi:hypothetical protein
VDVVVAVSVEVCADVLLLKDSELEERLHVVGLVAPVGAVTVQLSATVPVNELPGVTVIVAVLSVVAPALTVMLPLLLRVKLVLLLSLGACQKSPQPASSIAAANNPAQRPIFIAIPFAPSSRCAFTGTRSQGIACQRLLSCCRRARNPAPVLW